MILKAEFEEAVWQKIVDMLVERPYKEAAPIINALVQQLQAQRETDAPGEDNVSALRRN